MFLFQSRLFSSVFDLAVQDPISANTNILWKSPSFGKNYSYRLRLPTPGFMKPPLFYLLQEKNGSNSSIFSGIAHRLGCVKKQQKIIGIAMFSISIKLRRYYFSINSKVFFQQRACNYLSPSNTNHSFSFHLCPIGNTLTYSMR